MQTQPRRGSPVPVWQIRRYEGTALIVVLLLSSVTVLSFTHEGLLALARSNVLGASFTTLSILIALAAAFVALSEFFLYGLCSSLAIALAFLVFAAGHVLLRLIPLLAGLGHEVNWAPYGWGLSDCAAGGLFIAAGLTTDRGIEPVRRRRALGLSLLLVVFLAIAVAIIGYQGGGSSVPKAAQTPVPVLAAILFFTAAVLFWRTSKTAGLQWYFWLSLSLTLAGFAEFQYAIHQYPVNVVQPGDVFRLIFFASILLALAAEWSVNYRRLRWQTQELEGFHALMTAPVVQDVRSVMQHIEMVAGDTLQADIHILLVGRGEGPGDETVELGGVGPATSNGGGGSSTEYLNDVAPDEDEPGRISFGMPLRTVDRRLGMMYVARPTNHDLSAFDLRLLRAFAAQASILLERSLLYEETAAGAVIQERSRLAREIHDGLAQHLAFLKMRVAWLKRSPASINETQLQEIEGVLETALIEARHAITTLRSEPKGTSTVEDIVAYVEQFQQVSGLDVAIQMEDNLPEIGPKSRVELLRVVQEALNNVRKHAHASHVDVQIMGAGTGLEIAVKDNGAGFDPNQNVEGHFGLEIMRERAESIRAEIEVSSQPGAGTCVRVRVPGHETEAHAAPLPRLGVVES